MSDETPPLENVTQNGENLPGHSRTMHMEEQHEDPNNSTGDLRTNGGEDLAITRNELLELREFREEMRELREILKLERAEVNSLRRENRQLRDRLLENDFNRPSLPPDAPPAGQLRRNAVAHSTAYLHHSGGSQVSLAVSGGNSQNGGNLVDSGGQNSPQQPAISNGAAIPPPSYNPYYPPPPVSQPATRNQGQTSVDFVLPAPPPSAPQIHAQTEHTQNSCAMPQNSNIQQNVAAQSSLNPAVNRVMTNFFNQQPLFHTPFQGPMPLPMPGGPADSMQFLPEHITNRTAMTPSNQSATGARTVPNRNITVGPNGQIMPPMRVPPVTGNALARVTDPSRMQKYIGDDDIRTPIKFVEEFETNSAGFAAYDQARGVLFVNCFDKQRFPAVLSYPAAMGYEYLKEYFLQAEWGPDARDVLLRNLELAEYDQAKYGTECDYYVLMYSKLFDCGLSIEQIYRRMLRKMSVEFRMELSVLHFTSFSSFTNQCRLIARDINHPRNAAKKSPGYIIPGAGTSLMSIEAAYGDSVVDDYIDDELAGNE